MNSEQIASVLNGVHCFLGVYPANKIPTNNNGKFPYCFVANMDTASKPGSHWVAVYIPSQGVVEYFDSFGKWPPANRTLFRFLRTFPTIRKLAIKNKGNGNVGVQSTNENSCGAHTIFFIRSRIIGQSFHQIESELRKWGPMSDPMVKFFVYKWLVKI